MNSSFTFEEPIDLSRFNHLYRTDAPAEPRPSVNAIPDGRYEVVVAEASLTTSQSSGNPMIRWVLRITGSTFRDRVLRKHSAITEKSLPYVKKELEMCGLRLASFSDLAERVSELEGVELEVAKITKDNDSKVYFNRAITSQRQPDGESNDELPF